MAVESVLHVAASLYANTYADMYADVYADLFVYWCSGGGGGGVKAVLTQSRSFLGCFWIFSLWWVGILLKSWYPPILDAENSKIKVPWPNETVARPCKAGKLASQEKHGCPPVAGHNQQPAGPTSPTYRFRDEQRGDMILSILMC